MGKTWGELKDEIKAEANIEAEDFVSDDELQAWGNDAIRSAEKLVVQLHDKYLETSEALTGLTVGTSDYALPTTIYANKITGIYYQKGTHKYEITPLRLKKDALIVNDDDEHRYRIVNKSATDGAQLRFFPAIQDDSATITIWFIRQAELLDNEDSTAVVDLPIADGFVKRYIKDKITEKEVGPGGFQWPSQALQKEEASLVEALNNMIPDENSDVDIDVEFYEDFDETWPVF